MSTAATPKFASISALRGAIVSKNRMDPATAERMLHKIPSLPTVKDRGAYLKAKAAGKVVLDIGCTGKISESVRAAAKVYYGLDRVPVEGCEVLDLDHRPDLMPKHEDVEVVLCSEVLEHLGNPGYFLMALKQHYAGRPVYFTAPNAGSYTVMEDCEVVHRDHVSWYSYQTLLALLTRYGYSILEARWYNSPPNPHKSEGIIMAAQ